MNGALYVMLGGGKTIVVASAALPGTLWTWDCRLRCKATRRDPLPLEGLRYYSMGVKQEADNYATSPDSNHSKRKRFRPPNIL
jgi:hypothetical protein